ncbi:MAG TPA: ATP synthase F1 subunit epsilon [Bacilli bacterium]|nr:ATP synthase F1 subunit epsilon [Bacilli bacterium]
MERLTLEILTPERKKFSGEVDLVHVPTKSGPYTVLPNTYPLNVVIETGELYYQVDGQQISFAISGGVLMVKKDITTILAETIERFDEIDSERAKMAKKRAEEIIAKQESNKDVKKATAALMRALTRLKVGEYSGDFDKNPSDSDLS